MALRKSITDFKNNCDEILEYCADAKQTVFITGGDKGDFALLSKAEYERIVNENYFHAMLEEGLENFRKGKARPASDVMRDVFGDLENYEKIYGTY